MSGLCPYSVYINKYFVSDQFVYSHTWVSSFNGACLVVSEICHVMIDHSCYKKKCSRVVIECVFSSLRISMLY